LAQKIPSCVWAFRVFSAFALTAALVFPLSGCAGRQAKPSYDNGSVRFSITVPKSAQVYLVLFQTDSSEPTLRQYPVRDNRDGRRVAVVRIGPGEYHYFFQVDGRAEIDPGAPRVEKDDFGGGNGVFTLEINNDGSANIY